MKAANNLALFQAYKEAFLELLESPYHYAVVAGFRILAMHPGLVSDKLPDIILTIDRGIASSSLGVIKQAIRCLGQLAINDTADWLRFC